MLNTVLAFIQMTIIGMIIIWEYKSGFISVIMWAVLLLMFGLPHFIMCLTGNSVYSEHVILDASLFVTFFCIIYFIFRLFFKLLFTTNVIETIKQRLKEYHEQEIMHERVLIRFVFFLYLLYLFCFLLATHYNFGTIINVSWGDFYYFRISSSGFLIIILFAQIYIINSLGGVVLLAFLRKEKVILFSFLFIILFTVFLTQNRILMLPLINSFLLLFFIRNRKLGLKKIITLSLIALLSLYVIYGFRVFRHSGNIKNLTEQYTFRTFNQRIMEMYESDDGELGLRNIFYFFIENKNDFHGFNQLATYKRLLLAFLPTQYSMGLKPPDFAITMGSAYSGNNSNKIYSVHPTLFGDCYANLGGMGIVLGVFWATFSFICDFFLHRIQKLHVQILSTVMFLTMYITIARGSVYNGFIVVFWGSIALFILSFCLGFLSKSVNESS